MQSRYLIKDVVKDLKEANQHNGKNPDPAHSLQQARVVSNMMKAVLGQNQTLMIRMVTKAKEDSLDGNYSALNKLYDILNLSPEELQSPKWKSASITQFSQELVNKFNKMDVTDKSYKLCLEYIDQYNLFQKTPFVSALQVSYDELNKLYQSKSPRGVAPFLHHISSHDIVKEPYLSQDAKNKHNANVNLVHDMANMTLIPKEDWKAIGESIQKDSSALKTPFISETRRNGGVAWDAEHKAFLMDLADQMITLGPKHPGVVKTLNYIVPDKAVREQNNSYSFS